MRKKETKKSGCRLEQKNAARVFFSIALAAKRARVLFSAKLARIVLVLFFSLDALTAKGLSFSPLDLTLLAHTARRGRKKAETTDPCVQHDRSTVHGHKNKRNTCSETQIECV